MNPLFRKIFIPKGKAYQILNHDLTPESEFDSKEIAILFCWLTFRQKVLDVKADQIIYG